MYDLKYQLSSTTQSHADIMPKPASNTLPPCFGMWPGVALRN